MNKDEKIRYIYDLLHKNVTGITSVTISTETGKTLFCLLVKGKSISVIIEDRFIEEKTYEKIESFLNDNLFHEISENVSKITPVGKDITIWPNDENCQRLNRQ